LIFGAGSGLGGDSHAQLLLVNERSLSRGFNYSQQQSATGSKSVQSKARGSQQRKM